MAHVDAYIDSSASGLVACRVVGADMHRGYLRLKVRVTAHARPRQAYAAGEVLDGRSPLFTVPRDCVRKFRYSPFPKILPYSWPERLANAGIVIEGAAP